MQIQKARWTTDGDNFNINMPLQKIDKENRLVSGWASLDNLDLQGDIVLASASEKAFASFRGNIREMHQPIAVGRMVSYKPDTYYDPVTEKMYNGIFVTAYVSKGAQSTWEKVLDGTLQAFSIKGPIKDFEEEFSKDSGTKVRIVKDYGLEELSLVDSGGNQLANLVSVMKVNGSPEVTGIVADNKSQNVFYCDKHEGGLAKTSTEDSLVCHEGHKMENIGWFEYADDNEMTQKVGDVVKKHITANDSKQDSPATDEGGVDVAEENDKATEEVVPGSTAPEVIDVDEQGKAATEVDASQEAADNSEVSDEETEDDKVAKAADVSEVEGDEPDLQKMFADLQNVITGGLEKSAKDSAAAIEAVKETFEKKFNELNESHAELTKKFDGIRNDLENVEKRVGGVESDTAVKKSGDLGGSSEDTLEKRNPSKGSIWGGAFLRTTDQIGN